METISLQQVLPAVFAQNPPDKSGIWLQEVTFSKGVKYLIEAESGTGKSSLFSYLYGYRNDYSGSIVADGSDVKNFSIGQWGEIRKNCLSLMFQELRLFPELSAIDNVNLKNSLTGHKSQVQIRELFEQLKISDKIDSPVAKMSFGQQQRVAFIRTLCQKADFFLLDEPISHLDEANSAIMARLLTEEAEVQGAGIIVSSIGKHLGIRYDKTIAL